MGKRITLLCFGVLNLFFCYLWGPGCGSSPPPQARTQAIIPGYLGLREEFGDLDFSPLIGRRIVLDPGHGGFFRGAVGPKGLTEAEVNLGVALYLRGLLEWAGAKPFLTRSADYDFLTPADSSLTQDLKFRTSFTDSLQPDVFISIHHNSTASKDPDINETQTYYPLGDSGASLDLAQCIHRHLVLNLEITPAKILPGNFHVLRNCRVPAILGEPAMISNPVMEGRLSLAASHELEAQAYFLGLLDYFAAGQPVWNSSAQDTVFIQSGIPFPSISWKFLDSESPQVPGPGPDPSTFVLTLDGNPQGFELSPASNTVTWRPNQSLSPGHYRLQLSGKNLKGRATPQFSTSLVVGNNSHLKVRISREQGADSASLRTLLYWETRDRQPASPGFLAINNSFQLLIPPRAKGWFLLPAGIRVSPEIHFRPRDGALDQRLVPEIMPEAPLGFRWRLATKGENPEFASSPESGFGWFSRLAVPESLRHPLSGGGSPAFLWQPGQAVWIEAEGFLPIVDPGTPDPQRGRTLPTEMGVWRPRLLMPDLYRRTIVIDPAGGGTDQNGTFSLGARGADINLAIARQVKKLLQGAGARVVLTRNGENAPDSQAKVLLAQREKADLFLTISQALPGKGSSVRHHPGSRVGIRWAQSLAEALAPMDSVTIGQSYAYLLRHTACPALELSLKTPTDPESEIVFTSQPHSMAVARGLFLACTAVFSPDNLIPPTKDPVSLLRQLPHGLPIETVEWACWDGNYFFMVTPSRKINDVLFSSNTPGWPAPPGMHTLAIHSATHWQLWLVELTHQGATLNLMMGNR